MINYFNFKPFKDKVLITNDMGKYRFITEETMKALIEGGTVEETEIEGLKQDFFIYDGYEPLMVEKAKYHIRDSKNYLFGSTSLHIFVLTNICNMSCVYCQAKDDTSIVHHKMTAETAEKCVDVALQSPSRFLSFEFQGGEPLANFEILKHIVLYAEQKKGSKCVSFNVVSNLTLLTDEMLEFLIEHNVGISTSIDGDEELHNKNRGFSNGVGTYKAVTDSIKKIQEKDFSVGAIQTTTRYSLCKYKEIIDEYVRLNQTSIFIRPLTRLGTAARVWDEIGYTPEEFVEFYKKSLRYILELNKSGINICENHAVIFLRKIVTGVAENYMELRSPCGAAIGQVAYFYDGNVFTCDEGRMLYEMGKDDFKLGNVYENTYDELMQSPVCKAVCVASCLESQLNCCDCVYQPYCGTCPVISLAQEKDLFFKDRNAFRCMVYKGMLDTIFEVLYENNEDDIKVFNKWLGVCTNE
ncbi:MAG: His-Xaa-Ser system radical SAM maturase HxsB [Clostridia bacterium]|nr:His-Xaa-Ser system radical SAM maturase HxsB [Clostridia bacterium]